VPDLSTEDPEGAEEALVPARLPGAVSKPGLLKRLIAFAEKHPGKATAATIGGAGTLGTVAAIPRAGSEARKLEAKMLEGYTGAPGGKYVYAELEDFNRRKQYLGEKTATCKVASYTVGTDFYPSVESGIASGIGKGIAQSGIEALGKLIRGTARSVQARLVLDKQREAIVDHIMQYDPIVSIQERTNPGSTLQAYATMVKFAPTLSTDPNVVTSFLRETSQSEGGLNPLTVKQLADTEQSVNKALERFQK